MLLFLDTEYTGLKQRTPGLISLGIVAEDGRRELYFELADTWKIDDCTAFVRKEVLPLLEGAPITREQGRARLREWFLNAPRAVQIACDSGTDFAFLLELLGNPPPINLAATYYDLRPLIDTTVYDQAVSSWYQKDNRMHNALVDARAYRRGWLAWMDARKVAGGDSQV
ncbi:hypothetical protein ABWH74_002257 [Burkholderia vietnamiensis]|jgi:hypothetical protein|uniref:hypothetical protein n=1 Tax=Burkholderia TaxID=32008 RepID=UPI000759515F|nr:MULTISPECIES: hypothetical protein [Burkholderia]AWU99384.1 hypothetical protein DM992_07330 [Burkholderia sp. JP2-270]KVF40941.1 hypothetical protein WJ09_24815 [Burkholderia vietnamiensis]KVF67779.1 hypothetical protein WJ17_16335 [Burkholderia vietnamiensis]MBR8283777.1 hypothetical protein [Burkholderia vietnamiensis]MDN7411429.1 hypothetical protein [Burkholderia vietnamiensis]